MASSSNTKIIKNPFSAVYRAASDLKNSESLKIIRDFWINNGLQVINNRGDTILHNLAIYGNYEALSALIDEGLVTNENLMVKNVNGDTALHEAARFGQKRIAEKMLQKDSNLAFDKNSKGETPLFVAAEFGEDNVFELLKRYNSDGRTRRDDGWSILHASTFKESYCLAIKILETYPDLARARDNEGRTALHILASKPHSFKSGSPFYLRGQNIYSIIPFALAYYCVPELYNISKRNHDLEDRNDHAIVISKVERRPITKFILAMNVWIREVDDAKQIHIIAKVLAERLIEKEDWNQYIYTQNTSTIPSHKSIEERYPNPLLQAAKLGISEVVVEILRLYPEAADTFDNDGRNVLHLAVEQKHNFLFDYLMKAAHRDRMLVDVDNCGNTIMHLATNAGGPNAPPGVLHQMIWDIFWYKRVKYISPPHLWHVGNNKGLTAQELFDQSHLNVRRKAETTLKEMVNSALIVSVLIGTINFAAIFTVPGGFDQTYGLPLLRKYVPEELRWFMEFLAGGLFSSLVTMGVLLSILFSRFDNEDFHIALPVKYCLALFGCYFATSYTILACVEAFILTDMLTNVPDAFRVLLSAACLTIVIFIDTSFFMFDHIYYLIRYSRDYRVRDL